MFCRIFRIVGLLVCLSNAALGCLLAPYSLHFFVFTKSWLTVGCFTLTVCEQSVRHSKFIGCYLCPFSEIIFSLFCSQLWNVSACGVLHQNFKIIIFISLFAFKFNFYILFLFQWRFRGVVFIFHVSNP